MNRNLLLRYSLSSFILGFGVFTKKIFQPGEFLVEYKGTVLLLLKTTFYLLDCLLACFVVVAVVVVFITIISIILFTSFLQESGLMKKKP